MKRNKIDKVTSRTALIYAWANPGLALEIAKKFPEKAVEIADDLCSELAVQIAKARPETAPAIANLILTRFTSNQPKTKTEVNRYVALQQKKDIAGLRQLRKEFQNKMENKKQRLFLGLVRALPEQAVAIAQRCRHCHSNEAAIARAVPKQALAIAKAIPVAAPYIAKALPKKAVAIALAVPAEALEIAQKTGQALAIALALHEKYGYDDDDYYPRWGSGKVEEIIRAFPEIAVDFVRKLPNQARSLGYIVPDQAVAIAKALGENRYTVSAISEDFCHAFDDDEAVIVAIAQAVPKAAVAIARCQPLEVNVKIAQAVPEAAVEIAEMYADREQPLWMAVIARAVPEKAALLLHHRPAERLKLIAQAVPEQALFLAWLFPEVAYEVAEVVPEKAKEIALLFPHCITAIVAQQPALAVPILKERPDNLQSVIRGLPADQVPALVKRFIRRIPGCYASALAYNHPELGAQIAKARPDIAYNIGTNGKSWTDVDYIVQAYQL